MDDNQKSKAELIAELEGTRQRIAELEQQEKARRQAEQQVSRSIDLLNWAGEVLTGRLDLQEKLKMLLKMTTEILNVTGSSLWQLDPVEEGWLVCKAISNVNADIELVDHRLRPGQGVAGWVAEQGESALVTRTEEEIRFSSEVDEKTHFKTISLIAVPMKVRDRVLGVIEVVNKLNGQFDITDRLLVETLAAFAAVAIELDRLERTIKA